MQRASAGCWRIEGQDACIQRTASIKVRPNYKNKVSRRKFQDDIIMSRGKEKQCIPERWELKDPEIYFTIQIMV